MQAPASPPASPGPADALVSIYSEVAPLRQVVVHTPGEEMALLTPDNRAELLFDDILFAEQAEEEHQVMCRIFRAVVAEEDAVLQVSKLLSDAFAMEDARYEFVDLLAARLPESNLRAYAEELKRLAPEELHRFALTGLSPLPLTARPVPNLIFTRDLSAAVGEHVILSHPATPARARESLIMRVVLRHHPLFESIRGRLLELPPHVHFEGGDLLVVDERVVLIGQSERTSLSGVMAVTQALLEQTSVEHVLMVELPRARYCMHLDTVFTFASEDECVVFPPLIETDGHNVYHLTARDIGGADRPQLSVEVWPNNREAIAALTGRQLEFIRCGGDELLHQRREQWTDGANLFALAPGVVIGYERNQRTYAALKDHGYHVVDAESFLDFYGDGPVPLDQKIAIQLRGHELSRGRGGPRCMTMPIRRAAGSQEPEG
jgi:arginine deiminase